MHVRDALNHHLDGFENRRPVARVRVFFQAISQRPVLTQLKHHHPRSTSRFHDGSEVFAQIIALFDRFQESNLRLGLVPVVRFLDGDQSRDGEIVRVAHGRQVHHAIRSPTDDVYDRVPRDVERLV